jgi:hypothetical protein
LIAETVEKFPAALESVKYGYDCFEAVYPIPVWRCAYERAVNETGAKRGDRIRFASLGTVFAMNG